MNIIEKMAKVSEKFEATKGLIVQREKEIQILSDELKTLQGEYRALVDIGQELGILDQNGQPIPVVPIDMPTQIPADEVKAAEVTD